MTYWTGIWEPRREAISKEVAALRDGIGNRGPVVSFSSGQRTHWLPRGGVVRLSSRRWLLLRALAALIEPRGDLTHVVGEMNAWHLLRSVGRRPVVFTIVAPGPLLERRLLDKVTLFLPQTDALADSLLDAGIDAERVEVIRPGVDLKRFRVAAAPAAAKFRILFASSPATSSEIESRGIPLLVEAARKRPDVEFLVLGRRWGDESTIRRSIQSLGPPDNLTIEWRDVDDMAAVYARSHATVALFREGFGKSCPTSVIEGLACGKPAIVTDSCGIAKSIVSAGAGFAVAPEITAVLEAIDSLRAGYAQFAERARALAEHHHDAETWLERHARCYERVLGH